MHISSIEIDWNVVIGLTLTTMGLGFGIGNVIRHIRQSMGEPPIPSQNISTQWRALIDQQTGGYWIGLVERPIFFAALWTPGAWPILSSWLVFKLAFYWQSANFTAFPEKLPNEEEANYLVAKRQLGSYHVATALVGTGANIVLALIGVVIGRWIKLP